MRSLLLLFLTILLPLARAFDVSWLTVPKDDDIYETENEIPPPRIRPDKPSKPSYQIYTHSLYEEENRVCSKFYCDKKPCCTGECINMFGSHLCILFQSHGRRRK